MKRVSELLETLPEVLQSLLSRAQFSIHSNHFKAKVSAAAIAIMCFGFINAASTPGSFANLNCSNGITGVTGLCSNSFTNFSVDSVKTSSASVSWTPGVGNSSFYLEYGIAGFTLGNGTKITGSYPGAQPPVSLTGLMADTTYEVYFGEICNSGADSVKLANAQVFKTLSSCPVPAFVSISIIGDTLITAAVSGSSTTYDVMWGPRGFSQASAGVGNITSGSVFTLDSLLYPGGAFDLYVRSNCGIQGVSAYLGPIPFSTNCVKQTLPYNESFNTTLGCMRIWDGGADTSSWQWQPTGGSITPGDLNGSGYAGVDSDEHGNNIYMREMLVSPTIDAGSISGALVVEFDQFYQNIGADSATVQVYDGANWVEVLVMKQTLGAFGNPNHQYLNVTPYANSNFQVRFLYDDGNTWAWWWLIDNLTVREVQCTPSTAFINNFKGADTASFSWIQGSANRFMIEYGNTGFTPGTGIKVMTSGPPFGVGGLSPQTSYDFYLIDSCLTGFGDTLGPVTFRTACLRRTLPYFESFNSNLGCANTINGGGNLDTWQWEPAGGTTVSGDLDGTGFAVVNSDQYGSVAYMRETLITPKIDAGSLPQTSALILEFDHFFQWVFSNDSGAVDVYDGTNWVNVYTVKATTGAFSAPDHQKIDVTAYANTDFQVRFVYDDGNVWAWWWLVDNISVTEVLCGFATNPDTISVSVDSAQLSWNSSGANWNINWGPAGFSQGTGSGFFIKNITKNPYTLAGLSKNTCYDYYVQDTCIGIGKGPWAGPYTFCTKASCPVPNGINAIGITSTTANIGWNAGGQAMDFNIEYGVAGFTRGNGFFVNTTAPNVSLSGLIASTTYDVYIRDSCGIGDVSQWVKFTFRTNCPPFNIPYKQTFANSAIPACYSFSNTSLDPLATWLFAGTWPRWGANGTNNAPGSLGGSFGVDGSTPYDSAVSMTTPLFNVQSAIVPILKFKKFQNNVTTNQNITLFIDVFNGVSWTNGVIVDSSNSPTWVNKHLNLNSFSTSGLVQIRFRVNEITGNPSPFYSDILIDDIEILDSMGISCSAPLNAIATALSCDSLEVNWGNDADTTIISYGLAGSLPVASILVTTDSTGFITGTMANTSYDIYLSNICNGDTSAVVGPITVNTGKAGYPKASFTITRALNSLLVNLDASATTGSGIINYNWDFGDGSTGTGITHSHAYATGGAYCVKLTVTNRCGTSDTTICINDVSLVENALSQSLEVFPNPAKERVTVSFTSENGKQANIRILDPSGKVVMQLKQGISGNTFETEINLSGLADGVYLMEVSDGNLQVNHRLIKQ